VCSFITIPVHTQNGKRPGIALGGHRLNRSAFIVGMKIPTLQLCRGSALTYYYRIWAFEPFLVLALRRIRLVFSGSALWCGWLVKTHALCTAFRTTANTPGNILWQQRRGRTVSESARRCLSRSLEAIYFPRSRLSILLVANQSPDLGPSSTSTGHSPGNVRFVRVSLHVTPMHWCTNSCH
jgi:hypothetical protein